MIAPTASAPSPCASCSKRASSPEMGSPDRSRRGSKASRRYPDERSPAALAAALAPVSLSAVRSSSQFRTPLIYVLFCGSYGNRAEGDRHDLWFEFRRTIPPFRDELKNFPGLTRSILD